VVYLINSTRCLFYKRICIRRFRKKKRYSVINTCTCQPDLFQSRALVFYRQWGRSMPVSNVVHIATCPSVFHRFLYALDRLDCDRLARCLWRTQHDVDGTERTGDGEIAGIILEELAFDVGDVDSGGLDDHGLDGRGA